MGRVEKKVFRAYDIRGVADRDLNDSLVYQIGQAIACRYPEAKRFALGRDGRLSSHRFAKALAAGLQAGSAQVLDVGEVPTPVLYFAAYEHCAGCGLMVTGSHNPPEYNGIKMVVQKHTLFGEQIEALYDDVCAAVSSTKPNGHYEQIDVAQSYIEKIARDIHLKRPLKLVIDCGNGVAGPYARALFERLGCEVDCLYCEVDGHFPNHHANPSVEKNLQDLIATVKHKQAALGLAFDGDGDRLGVVDERGQIIWPDRQMMLYAQAVLHHHPRATIIYDVKSSRHLSEIIKRCGGQPQMCRTGHSFIKAMLKQTNAPLAGEMSGHIFFNDRWYGFDDALYAGARLLEILSASDKSCSEYFRQFPEAYSTPEINVAFSCEGEQHDFMKQFIATARFDGGQLDYTDGVRVDFEDGWGLVRASHTTPCLVIRFEADSRARLQEIQTLFHHQIKAVASGLQLPF